MVLCLSCYGVGGELVGDLEQCLEEWGGVKSMFVVSLDYLC